MSQETFYIDSKDYDSDETCYCEDLLINPDYLIKERPKRRIIIIDDNDPIPIRNTRRRYRFTYPDGTIQIPERRIRRRTTRIGRVRNNNIHWINVDSDNEQEINNHHNDVIIIQEERNINLNSPPRRRRRTTNNEDDDYFPTAEELFNSLVNNINRNN